MDKVFTPLKEKLTFLKRWCANPYRVGSFMPSSQALARLVAKSTLERWQADEYVVELGAGTGCFTQALIDAKFPAERLLCLEIDTRLSSYLSQRFPKIKIIQGNACGLDMLIPQNIHKQVGVVISGLPMLAFPYLVQKKIIDGCLQVLKPGGCMIQFTYSPFSSIDVKRFQMKKNRLGWVWWNIPPAGLWCYKAA